MTGKKQLKTRIRARMAKTGESYTTARMHVAGVSGFETDHGWTLYGGRHSASAAVANILRNGGFPVSEPLVYVTGGGIGAGYILWEFKHHDAAALVLGFRNRWQYPLKWMDTTLTRLGVPFDAHTTGGAKGASARLSAELAAGRACVILPDRYHMGYWHAPAHLDGYGGHPVVVYREDEGGVYIDDRNLAPLRVERDRLDAARGRVGSYKNQLHAVTPAKPRLEEAVLAGLRDCAAHLSGSSDSFSLPAWRKWSRAVVDGSMAKGWPKAFADGRGLAHAMLSAWEAVEPVGTDGGNHRDIFADGLDEAADLLNLPLHDLATEFRRIHGLWHEFAETALPEAANQRVRELIVSIRASVAEGSAGAADAAAAAEEMWALKAEAATPSPDFFPALSERIAVIYDAETTAIAALREALPAE
ncbi:BtrH N-terminal domain-containing protein [Herbidospora mongoliensis]|uniref:BtrH N-terminal domain-containing protein n=1 Tax=Herbidospora mongoliensis TaxID=688067 RepID=UPI000B061F48|nr:BtrH N-terminal domain-containing protein [Herbidospora mongoliensis]